MAKRKVSPPPQLAVNLSFLMSATPGLETQVALEKASGVPQSTIGRVLRSEDNASLEIWRRLAAALDVDSSAFEKQPEQFRELHEKGQLRHTPRPVSSIEMTFAAALLIVLRTLADLTAGRWAMVRAGLDRVVGHPELVDEVARDVMKQIS